MLKAFLPLLLVLGLASPSFAQSDTVTILSNARSTNELLFLRKEFGFSTKIVLNGIFNSTSGPVEIMYKKLKNGKWVRHGLALDVYRRSDFDYIWPTYSENSIYANAVSSMGYEKRKKLGSNWTLLYGADAFLSAFYRMQEKKSKINRTDNEFSYFDRGTNYSIGAGIRPFTGISFTITPRLYLSTEASASLGAHFGRRISELIQPNNEPYKDENNFWGGGINVTPASAIFVYYRF